MTPGDSGSSFVTSFLQNQQHPSDSKASGGTGSSGFRFLDFSRIPEETVTCCTSRPPLLSRVGKNVSPLQVTALLGCELPFSQKDRKDPSVVLRECELDPPAGRDGGVVRSCSEPLRGCACSSAEKSALGPSQFPKVSLPEEPFPLHSSGSQSIPTWNAPGVTHLGIWPPHGATRGSIIFIVCTEHALRMVKPYPKRCRGNSSACLAHEPGLFVRFRMRVCLLERQELVFMSL